MVWLLRVMDMVMSGISSNVGYAVHRTYKGDYDLVAAVNERGSFPSPSASNTQRAVALMLA
jgi:hypothetical protein